MTMGVFAIAGIPPFAGFFSKDEILYRTFADTDNPLARLLWAVGLITAGMTSFYMFRLWYKTFWGEERFEEAHSLHDHGAAVHATSTSTLTLEADHEESHGHGVHESPAVMLLPLVVLAILSVVGGWVGVPTAMHGHNEFEHFLEPVFASAGTLETVAAAGHESHALEIGLAVVSVATALLGWFLAWFLYSKKPGTANAIAKKAGGLYSLVANKFYVDEIYNAVFVTGLLFATRVLLKGFDQIGIDGSTRFVGWIAIDLSEGARRMQSGNIRSYAGWLALGAALVMAVMIFGRGIWVH
jgi:NADH-quinone oxidoreductase subunit L